MNTALIVGLSVYGTVAYIAGYNCFIASSNRNWGSWLAFAFSPITIPLGLGLLLLAY